MKMRNEGWDKNHGHVILKMDLADYENTRAFIEKTMKVVVPLAPYEAQIMEDSYAALYEEESRLGKAFNVFAFLALFIAGMGLFGMVSFQVVQRTKEIGIRKVLGSSVTDIVRLLSKDFMKLVIISLAIAVPIAYYSMNNWLEEYAYRIEIQWWVFVLVGLAAIGVALITISFQSIKAATANPINSLRAE
jgi:putative ABC transport system permease protein